MTSNIYNILKECKVEKDVEEKYKRVISEHFPEGEISSPYYTDGVLKNGLTMLMEFKFNLDLTKRLQLVELLIQLIYYLKQFELHGEELPSIVFGGDINECFCLHSNDLLPYLSEDLDWSIAPSAAPSRNPELAIKLSKDRNINPYIFYINNDHFDFKFVVDKIKQLYEGTVQKIRITELNINRFFSYFRDRIIKQKKKYSPEDLVSIFLNCLIDSDNNYPHPKKKNTLVTNVVGDVLINRSLYDAFFEHFESSYSVEEKKRLTAICDRLIADEARRFHGEFYTPTEWVLEAHKMIEEQFGPNWKEEYVVWDPAWGTGNLTRDFKFNELYCSTLNYGDLQVGQHYNPEAVKFQYDFLNDDVTPEGLLPIDKIKLPSGLVDALEKKKPMIILMNPPFGTAPAFRKKIEKSGMTKTEVNSLMLSKKMGRSAQQYYAQFLYRLLCLKEVYKTKINICLFSPSLFLTGPAFSNFRELFFNNFKYERGFIFNASNFSSVAGSWSVLFSMWIPEKNPSESFTFDIKELNDDYDIVDCGTKTVFNIDNYNRLSSFITEENQDQIMVPHFSSPLKVNDKEIMTLSRDNKGFYGNFGNSVYTNFGVNLACVILTQGNASYARSVTSENLKLCVAAFSGRKLTIETWMNQKDEYLAPNEQHPEYSQWNTDAIIYSLFNGSSNQSSLRQITYKDKLWDIKNEWFWMSNEQMLQLANENGFDELYHDANGDHDRFVFNKIQESSFSKDAADVYNKACELVINTFPYRQLLHEEHPEWHLHTWDAGWYQIKLILKKYFQQDLKDFNLLYKKFEDRMREGVYKFGFLK